MDTPDSAPRLSQLEFVIAMNRFESNHTAVMDAPSSPARVQPLAAEHSGSSRLRWLGAIFLCLMIAGGLAGLLPRLRQRAALRATSQELGLPTVSVVTAK